MIKRAFDIFFSALGLLLLSPLLAAIALVVLCDSSGPVIYRQWRMGKDFRPFSIWKFRTMTRNAERLGAAITLRSDARITRAGAWLRRYKLDELPQLFNILRGDMSFVGPRPEVARYVEMYRDEYCDILRVRPGITDLASLQYRNESELLGASAEAERLYCDHILPEKIRLSRLYLHRASLLFDLRLILRTLWAALRPEPRIRVL